VNKALLLMPVLVACSGDPATPGGGGGGEPDAAAAVPDGPALKAPLEIETLGVQGFALRYRGETVLTAPMFTRQSTLDVTFNRPLPSNTAAVEAGLAHVHMNELVAVVSGHAHYDHFIDVPHILAMAPAATAYTNLSGRHILAALAPDRAASCTSAAPSQTIARSRVIAMDDELASHVDYTNCPAQRPAGAPMEGSWLAVPNSHVRMMAFCSMHPAQVGPYHFGEGSIDSDQCDLPSAASGWLEGQTLAFVIDFLDDAGQPAFRVFYQDAPTNAPIGLVPPSVLASAPVDVALLCVGSNDSVQNQPSAILDNITPRFVLSGHWEDFFQPLDQPPQPIPLLDVSTYVDRANASLAAHPRAADDHGELLVDGVEHDSRQLLVQPNTWLTVPAR
jgi:hypothetical protein